MCCWLLLVGVRRALRVVCRSVVCASCGLFGGCCVWRGVGSLLLFVGRCVLSLVLCVLVAIVGCLMVVHCSWCVVGWLLFVCSFNALCSLVVAACCLECRAVIVVCCMLFGVVWLALLVRCACCLVFGVCIACWCCMCCFFGVCSLLFFVVDCRALCLVCCLCLV